ncbi:hypothetical protein [Nocardia sp. NPDC059228]|uniref:hypothetical protein n=1 Tax=Nocardia sp. NPDC059228 TaxID=3346777 RepID=UPI003678B6AD
MPHLKSLREFIEALDAIGEVQHIDTEVDWNLEIGAIIRRSYDLRAARSRAASRTAGPRRSSSASWIAGRSTATADRGNDYGRHRATGRGVSDEARPEAGQMPPCADRAHGGIGLRTGGARQAFQQCRLETTRLSVAF